MLYIEIITWQDIDIVFIHKFWYHSANEWAFKQVSSMIPKQLEKNDIWILPHHNLFIAAFNEGEHFLISCVSREC